jgi:hypothetical protein
VEAEVKIEPAEIVVGSRVAANDHSPQVVRRAAHFHPLPSCRVNLTERVQLHRAARLSTMFPIPCLRADRC